MLVIFDRPMLADRLQQLSRRHDLGQQNEMHERAGAPIDGAPGLDYLRAHFETLTLIDEIPVERFGRRIFNFQIYLGESYRP